MKEVQASKAKLRRKRRTGKERPIKPRKTKVSWCNNPQFLLPWRNICWGWFRMVEEEEEEERVLYYYRMIIIDIDFLEHNFQIT